jgi:hypothetical protein
MVSLATIVKCPYDKEIEPEANVGGTESAISVIVTDSLSPFLT